MSIYIRKGDASVPVPFPCQTFKRKSGRVGCASCEDVASLVLVCVCVCVCVCRAVIWCCGTSFFAFVFVCWLSTPCVGAFSLFITSFPSHLLLPFCCCLPMHFQMALHADHQTTFLLRPVLREAATSLTGSYTSSLPIPLSQIFIHFHFFPPSASERLSARLFFLLLAAPACRESTGRFLASTFRQGTPLQTYPRRAARRPLFVTADAPFGVFAFFLSCGCCNHPLTG
jgi:hypothetical protein